MCVCVCVVFDILYVFFLGKLTMCDNIPKSNTHTLQAFCFIATVAFIVVLGWMLIHLVLGWCKPSAASHSTTD